MPSTDGDKGYLTGQPEPCQHVLTERQNTAGQLSRSAGNRRTEPRKRSQTGVNDDG